MRKPRLNFVQNSKFKIGYLFCIFSECKSAPLAKIALFSYCLKLIYFGGINTEMIPLDVLNTVVLVIFAAKILSYGDAWSKNSG